MRIDECNDFDIAVIGMAGVFPMADSVESFWNNLIKERDCITRTDEKNGSYVYAYGKVENTKPFEAEAYGFTSEQEEWIDPQQKMLLQLCSDVLKKVDCESVDNNIGLFASADNFEYVWDKLRKEPELSADEMSNRKSYLDESLTARVSYALDLRGPSVPVKNACASSLLAVHMAVQSLINGECALAIAGGVNLTKNQEYYDGANSLYSPTGYLRPFDKQADGLVPGNGGGVVLLKRLSDCLEDEEIKNRIYAVIRGSAVNNDGRQKLGYQASSQPGEQRVMEMALETAEIAAEDVGYVEMHGTGTLFGDAMEVKAAKEVYGKCQNEKIGCGIGSVKSSVGNLNYAAGITGLIKTVLMVDNAKFVPTVHYTEASPLCELENSGLYVVNTYSDWNEDNRVACVHAFGEGGTNCSLVLENIQ